MDDVYMNAREAEAVSDMRDRMSQLRQAIIDHDYKWAKSIHGYLLVKTSEYWNYSDERYDMATRSDFAYDVMNSLRDGDVSVDELLDKYDRLFNPDSPNYGDFTDYGNIIHNSDSYTGPGA